jgi:hypothetical protein
VGKVSALAASGNESEEINQPADNNKRKHGVVSDQVSKRLRSGNSCCTSSFELLSTYYSESPDRKPLRLFRYNQEIFVLKPDLLAVLNLKNTRFQHLQKSQIISSDLFKSWAKENHINVGANTRLFIIANKSLVDLLVKFDETVAISKSLKQLIE